VSVVHLLEGAEDRTPVVGGETEVLQGTDDPLPNLRGSQVRHQDLQRMSDSGGAPVGQRGLSKGRGDAGPELRARFHRSLRLGQGEEATAARGHDVLPFRALGQGEVPGSKRHGGVRVHGEVGGRPAAVPVLDLHEAEPELLEHRQKGLLVGRAGAFQAAAGIVEVLAAHTAPSRAFGPAFTARRTVWSAFGCRMRSV